MYISKRGPSACDIVLFARCQSLVYQAQPVKANKLCWAMQWTPLYDVSMFTATLGHATHTSTARALLQPHWVIQHTPLQYGHFHSKHCSLYAVHLYCGHVYAPTHMLTYKHALADNPEVHY